MAEAFVENASHTCKHISNLLRHCSAERCFKLRFHGSNDLFCVQLVQRVLGNERVLELQDFFHDDLHFILGLSTLALNNIVISEYFIDIVDELNKNLGDFVLNYLDFEYALIFQVYQLLDACVVGLQED